MIRSVRMDPHLGGESPTRLQENLLQIKCIKREWTVTL